MLERARQYDTARFLEKLKLKLAVLRRGKNENFCDEDIDESPIEPVSRRVDIAKKVGNSQARNLFD